MYSHFFREHVLCACVLQLYNQIIGTLTHTPPHRLPLSTRIKLGGGTSNAGGRRDGEAIDTPFILAGGSSITFRTPSTSNGVLHLSQGLRHTKTNDQCTRCLVSVSGTHLLVVYRSRATQTAELVGTK